MIGSVVRQQRSPEKPKVSTRLRDAIMENWTETRSGVIATVTQKDEIWQEFWSGASNTKYWCPRKCAIQALSPVPPGGTYDAETLWNFDQGHALHDMFQQKILPTLGAQFLGSWQRYVPSDVDGATDDMFVLQSAGKEDGSMIAADDNVLVEWGFIPKPVLAEGEDPHNLQWKYRECKIRLMDERIVVKLDGILKWDGWETEVFELKSEKMSARDSLDPMVGGKARAHHVEQVMLAMHATGIRRARIVYIFKGSPQIRTALLEHEIVYNEAMAKELLARAKNCATAVRTCDNLKADNEDYRELLKNPEWLDENFPRLGLCPMKSKGLARYCDVREECFPKGYRKKKK